MKVHIITLAAFPYYSAESVHLALFSAALSERCDFELVIPVKPWRPMTWFCDIEKYYALPNAAFKVKRVLQLNRTGGAFLQAALRRAKSQGALAYLRQPYALEVAIAEEVRCAIELHALPTQRGLEAIRAAIRAGLIVHVFVITEQLRDDLIASLQLESIDQIVSVLPDAAEPHRFTPTQMLANAKPRVGYIGSMYPGKGIEVIVPLARECQEHQFLLFGGDRDDPALRKFGTLPDNLLLRGRIPYSEVPSAMNEFEIALLPNQPHVLMQSGDDIGKYTSPMKLFEYMAAGKAIISSDLPVLREVIRPEVDALVARHDDVASWVNAVERLSGDISLRSRLGAEARRQIESKFSYGARSVNAIEKLKKGMK